METGQALGTIVLIPIGPVSPDLVSWLEGRLAGVLSRPARTGEAIALPGGSYDERRHQYRGEAILRALRVLSYPDARRLLGLAEADCYAQGLNFIFGQASLNGRQAFVALARLRASFYGLTDDPGLYRQRALKECVHELGHTWGLGHCPDAHCVMHFSNSLPDTDAKEAAFCPRCRGQLAQAGFLRE
ncbi:MAG: archaemetzincin family Zn-dependent metalloprotease [Anaerolineae bacterium]